MHGNHATQRSIGLFYSPQFNIVPHPEPALSGTNGYTNGYDGHDDGAYGGPNGGNAYSDGDPVYYSSPENYSGGSTGSCAYDETG